jgi:ribosomal protein L24
MTASSKFQRGDRVVVKISDNEKGKNGTIVTAYPRRNIQDDCERVLIDGHKHPGTYWRGFLTLDTGDAQ